MVLMRSLLYAIKRTRQIYSLSLMELIRQIDSKRIFNQFKLKLSETNCMEGRTIAISRIGSSYALLQGGNAKFPHLLSLL